MSVLNFPASPSVGDTYTANGSEWTWDGLAWVGEGNAPPLSASYVTVTAESGLPDERVLSVDSSLTLVDGGPDTTVTLSITPQVYALGVLMFGDGVDGTAVLDGANTVTWATKVGNIYTMTRHAALADLTVNSGCELITASFLLWVAGTLTLNGHLHWDGNAASGTSKGNAQGNTYLGGGQAGGDSNSAGGNPGANQTASVAGAGGAGGINGAGTAGSIGGTVTAPTLVNGGVTFPHTLMGFFAVSGGSGGAGGGAGRGDGIVNAGAGGGGAGRLLLWIRYIAGNGIISADGGNGSDATAAGGLSGSGGGGGGGGGVVQLCTQQANYASLITVRANGGAGGAHSIAGGLNGNPGSSGLVVVIVL